VLVSHLDGVGNRLTLIVFVLPKETLAMACRRRAISWVPGGNRVVWIEKGWGTCHKWYPPHQWHACSGSSLWPGRSVSMQFRADLDLNRVYVCPVVIHPRDRNTRSWIGRGTGSGPHYTHFYVHTVSQDKTTSILPGSVLSLSHFFMLLATILWSKISTWWLSHKSMRKEEPDCQASAGWLHSRRIKFRIYGRLSSITLVIRKMIEESGRSSYARRHRESGLDTCGLPFGWLMVRDAKRSPNILRDRGVSKRSVTCPWLGTLHSGDGRPRGCH